jgi:small subunit ribosomal protein S4
MLKKHVDVEGYWLNLTIIRNALRYLCFALVLQNYCSSRQLVNHGHITINNKVVSIPSFQCRLNDIISVKNQSSSKTLVENNLKNNQVSQIPNHLKFDSSKVEATILDYCDRNDISLQLDELLVIEYYSRR